jgi:hypothetical protein
MKLQSNLGSVAEDFRKDLKMGGQLMLGKVLKIHPKYNTADILIVKTNDTLLGSEHNEGKFACKIAVNNAGYNPDTRKSYGVIEPLCEGDLVLVDFIDGYKTQPVIRGSLHKTMSEPENILSTKSYYQKNDTREKHKYLRVFPSQNYVRVDGEGCSEFTLNNKCFLKIDSNELSDDHRGTDFKDLLEKDKITGDTLSLQESLAKNLLAVFRDSFNDDDTTWTKFYVDKSGLIRFTRDNNDGTLTFLEIDKDGSFRIKRQQDNSHRDVSDVYSEILMKNTGDININLKNKCSISLTPDGDIDITSNKTINVHSSKQVNVTSGVINLN